MEGEISTQVGPINRIAYIRGSLEEVGKEVKDAAVVVAEADSFFLTLGAGE